MRLTDQQVREIMRLRLERQYGRYRIGALLGINPETVKNVLNGTSHTHITGGALRLRDREASRWRGGTRSFEESL